MEQDYEKAAYSVAGACRYLDCSRPTLYRLMDQGIIQSFHIGRRRLLMKQHLDSFLQERLAEAEAGR